LLRAQSPRCAQPRSAEARLRARSRSPRSLLPARLARALLTAGVAARRQCSLVVSERLVHSLALPADKRAIFDKARRIERSYVDDNPNLKWCTAAGCGNAIRAPKGHLGVKCSCGQRFCFKCNDEDHAPCSCEELAKWMVKCRDDSETYNWLMSNTKACPKCATSIEKNGGCNHMTCKNSSCKFEFCWVCLGPWKDHSGSTT